MRTFEDIKNKVFDIESKYYFFSSDKRIREFRRLKQQIQSSSLFNGTKKKAYKFINDRI